MAEARLPDPGSLEGRTAVVTGASSGIGREIARALAVGGARVLTVSRGSGDGAEVAAELRASTGNDAVRFLPADLSSVGDIKRVTSEIRDEVDRIDLLINNAGAFFSDRRTSPDGYELTFALNHLGYFVFTLELLGELRAAGSPDAPARVVSTSSNAARFGHMHWDDPMLEHDYGGWKAYGQSKLANLLFTFELARRLEDEPVVANAFHPGFVDTGFGSGNGFMSSLVGVLQRFFGRSVERGAATGIELATRPIGAETSGRYFVDGEVADPPREAQDTLAQSRLWSLSLELAEIDDDPTEASTDASETPAETAVAGAVP